MANYFKNDGKYIYLESSYAEFYIPRYYFETGGFAEDFGSTIKCLGVFNIGIFENGKLKEMRVLNLPTSIDIFVYDYEEREVELPGSDGKTICKVVKYNKGDKIMNEGLIQDASNAEQFLNYVGKGKIPSSIPYEKSIVLWRKNKDINGVHLGVTSVIEELILSVAYRSKKDPGIKFAQVIGQNDSNVSQYDYIMSNFRQICQYTSTFTALTFEDIDSMVTTSLNRTRNKTHETMSPIEDLIKL